MSMSFRDLQQLLERQQALMAKVEAEQKQQFELLQRQLIAQNLKRMKLNEFKDNCTSS